MTKKKKRIDIRLSDVIFKKLLAISSANNKTKTAIIEDLILAEYAKNNTYEKWFYSDLDKKLEK